MAGSVFIFRQDSRSDANRPILFREIWRGWLRQGWGWDASFNLIDGEEHFIQAYSRKKPCSRSEAVNTYQKLKPILEIESGDLIVVPHQPDYAQCTVMRAAGKYRFLAPLRVGHKNVDFRHALEVDPSSIKVFRRDMAKGFPVILRAVWGGKGYQGPVNAVRKQVLSKALASFAKLPLYPGSPGRRSDLGDPDFSSSTEGKRKVFYGTRMERDSRLRRAAVMYHGYDCQVCGFNFGKVYGDHGEEFIHVHHIKPLSEYLKPERVNVRKHLSVLCVNCHVMIHRSRQRTLSLAELRAMIRARLKTLR